LNCAGCPISAIPETFIELKDLTCGNTNITTISPKFINLRRFGRILDIMDEVVHNNIEFPPNIVNQIAIYDNSDINYLPISHYGKKY